MPLYEYEHLETPCDNGKRFEKLQRVDDPPLAVCPVCGGAVRRLIGAPNIATPAGNAGLRDKGFTKLVRRSDGSYENVTPRQGEPTGITREQVEWAKQIPDKPAKKPKVWQLDD